MALADRPVVRARLGDGRAVVIKADRVLRRHRQEVRALGMARDAGIAVPTLVFAATDRSPAVLVTEWIDGVSLAIDPGPWDAGVDALRAVHRLASDAFAWRDHMQREAATAIAAGPRLFGPAVFEEVHRRLAAGLAHVPETTATLIHGDAQPEHVLVDANGRAWLIDFGDSWSGDPLFDLVVLTLDHPDRRPESPLAATYRLHRWFTEALWLLDHGYDPAASVQGVVAELDLP